MVTRQRLLGVFATALAVAGGVSTAALAESTQAPDTCAFTSKGRKIGCLGDAVDCSLVTYWRKGDMWFMAEEIGPKDIELPEAEVGAQRIAAGKWRVIDLPLSKSRKRVVGSVVATNRAKTRWRITDNHGEFVATGHGPRGPLIAMVLLHFGSDVFC
jgi:hypothetical protein